MEGVPSHVRKAKACGLVAQHEVRLLLRVLLHKHGEGVALHSLEGLQLPVLEINEVRSQVVQEGSGVRGADNAAREGFEPVLKPPDGRSSFQPYKSTTATKLATRSETQCHTTIKGHTTLLVCPSLTRPRTSVDSKTCVQTTADQDATLRSSANLPLERFQTEELKCTHARPPRPLQNKFLHIVSVDHRNKGVPSTWRPSHKNQLLPYFRRSMTSATC